MSALNQFPAAYISATEAARRKRGTEQEECGDEFGITAPRPSCCDHISSDKVLKQHSPAADSISRQREDIYIKSLSTQSIYPWRHEQARSFHLITAPEQRDGALGGALKPRTNMSLTGPNVSERDSAGSTSLWNMRR
ncbi:hypothetical protein WMY93_031261 [Mugilogobius chulae]|uniref:Uncharacterized protein n=1 Tax=Mugilogobius chulae TaxID=88201 RepID=A0AAW0MGD2_9GOBI